MVPASRGMSLILRRLGTSSRRRARNQQDSCDEVPAHGVGDPSKDNGLTLPTVLLGFQIMAADASWIVVPRAGTVDAVELIIIEKAVLEALGIEWGALSSREWRGQPGPAAPRP